VKRIEANGGNVIKGKIVGILSVARAFGDFDFKDPPSSPLVSAEPYINVVELTPQDTHLVLASDGVWDVTNDEDIARITKGLTNANDMSAALLKHALKSSRDNNSIVVVTF